MEYFKSNCILNNIFTINDTYGGLFWNTYYDNNRSNFTYCGIAGNYCSCCGHNISLYNTTNNCSLIIFPNNTEIFNRTYELVYLDKKINYTVKLLKSVDSPTITYNCTNSLITCKNNNGTNVNIYLIINNTIVNDTNGDILNYYWNGNNNFTATCMINNTISSLNETENINCTNPILKYQNYLSTLFYIIIFIVSGLIIGIFISIISVLSIRRKRKKHVEEIESPPPSESNEEDISHDDTTSIHEPSPENHYFLSLTVVISIIHLFTTCVPQHNHSTHFPYLNHARHLNHVLHPSHARHPNLSST
ncbi:T-lymphocyte CD2 receptor-like protein [African swine fever virus]|uniref:CD2 homolog n=2 Tax=African swine fever virus TaxID=10497 RepID=A9JLS5_ASFPP|nr:T-lymphocyte CD2 receptor-like protein [African swine fever virus]YP_009703666.1 CD2 homolog [African swine fever virus OURT 88/3]AIY22408.1 T-lymphocyte CD2 receptor-like protein [African swine fever virus]UEN73068.1 EP402R [African swine fever virus]UEN73226.1 EP402R [African swine fever virus]CAN10406.1 CD2 homolog [African swine fever virus OURT 88/3]